MNDSLEEYRTYLEKLLKEKSTVTFSNGGKKYASVLMSILLKNTHKSVRMFCEGFKPDLITEGEYWDALEQYLSKSDKNLTVIVNSDKYLDKKPLKKLFETKRNRNNDGSIMVYQIEEEGRKIIKQQFNGALNNFAIFDNDMYRLEYQPSEFKAFGSFNDIESTKLLQDLFDRILLKSHEINGANI